MPSSLQTTFEPTESRSRSAGNAENGSSHGWLASCKTPVRSFGDHFLTTAERSSIRVSFCPSRCSEWVSGRTRSALNPCDQLATWKATAVWRLTASLDADMTSL